MTTYRLIPYEDSDSVKSETFTDMESIETCKQNFVENVNTCITDPNVNAEQLRTMVIDTTEVIRTMAPAAYRGGYKYEQLIRAAPYAMGCRIDTSGPSFIERVISGVTNIPVFGYMMKMIINATSISQVLTRRKGQGRTKLIPVNVQQERQNLISALKGDTTTHVDDGSQLVQMKAENDRLKQNMEKLKRILLQSTTQINIPDLPPIFTPEELDQIRSKTTTPTMSAPTDLSTIINQIKSDIKSTHNIDLDKTVEDKIAQAFGIWETRIVKQMQAISLKPVQDLKGQLATAEAEKISLQDRLKTATERLNDATQALTNIQREANEEIGRLNETIADRDREIGQLRVDTVEIVRKYDEKIKERDDEITALRASIDLSKVDPDILVKFLAVNGYVVMPKADFDAYFGYELQASTLALQQQLNDLKQHYDDLKQQYDTDAATAFGEIQNLEQMVITRDRQIELFEDELAKYGSPSKPIDMTASTSYAPSTMFSHGGDLSASGSAAPIPVRSDTFEDASSTGFDLKKLFEDYETIDKLEIVSGQYNRENLLKIFKHYGIEIEEGVKNAGIAMLEYYLSLSGATVRSV